MHNSERLHILQMIESGDVSVNEAIGMMAAPAEAAPAPPQTGLDRGTVTAPLPPSVEETQATKKGQWLRVRVSNLETGTTRVSVNVPLGLMRWGIGLCSRFAPELEEVDLDELVRELDQFPGGHIVQVEDVESNERVEILIE